MNKNNPSKSYYACYISVFLFFLNPKRIWRNFSILTNFSALFSPQIREQMFPYLANASDCLPTTGCSTHPIGTAAQALQNWIGLDP